MVGVLKTRL